MKPWAWAVLCAVSAVANGVVLYDYASHGQHFMAFVTLVCIIILGASVVSDIKEIKHAVR